MELADPVLGQSSNPKLISQDISEVCESRGLIEQKIGRHETLSKNGVVYGCTIFSWVERWQSQTWFMRYTHRPQILNLLGKIVHSHPFTICLHLSSIYSFINFVLRIALFKLWSSPTPIVFDNCSSPSKKMMDKQTVLKNMCYHYTLK